VFSELIIYTIVVLYLESKPMKVFSYLFLSCLSGVICWLFVANTLPDNAFASTWQDYEMNNRWPDEILDDIVDHGKSDIVKTKLDWVTNMQEFNAENKISGTLESVRENISFYLQRVVYIALSGAVLLIIYNWLRLVLSPVSAEESSAIKTRMIYISLWIVLVTWFYFVLKIVLAIYYQIFVS
jgi:hypothetical protein